MYIHTDIESGVLESGPLNKRFRDIYLDITDLYTTTRSVKSEQLILNAVVENSSDTVLSKIQELQQQVAMLEVDTVVKSLYSTDGVIYPTDPTISRAIHEADYGRAILAINNTNRLFLTIDTANGKLVPVDNITDYIDWYSSSNRISSDMDEIVETNISGAFNPDPNELYMRKFTTSKSDVTEVDLLLDINMIAQTETINSIKIHPFPEGSVNIKGFTYEYDNITGQQFQKLNGDYYDTDVEEARKQAYSFKPVDLNSIKLMLEQKHRKYAGPYSFFLGLHSIILENNIYENSSYIGFELTRDSGNINQIDLLQTNFDDDSYDEATVYYIYDNLTDFDGLTENYLYTSQNNEAIAPGNPLIMNGDTDTIYVLVKMVKGTVEATPELNYLMVKWS